MKTIVGTHDDSTIAQFNELNPVHSALMADGHYGYVMPVGGVAAYDNAVSVVGVGFDIACGNKVVKLPIKLSTLSANALTLDEIIASPKAVLEDAFLHDLANSIANRISFGIGGRNKQGAFDDLPLFSDPRWEIIPGTHRQDLFNKAKNQLGTVGGGNHYVDVFVGPDDYIWVGVHFGSRGFGHTVASGFLALGQDEKWGSRVKEQETLFSLDTQLGQDYWNLMELAGDYAYAGRDWVIEQVSRLITTGAPLKSVHNHHNFAWKETHFGQELVVIRKGATPAFPGQEGFVGGSMGDDSVILSGRDVPQSADLLYSTVHGAGRVMSRTAAAGSKWKRKGSRGAISQQMMDTWLTERGVIRRGGDRDESPHVYRRLSDVLTAQGDTIEVQTILRPLIVAMAPPNVHDPYKD